MSLAVIAYPPTAPSKPTGLIVALHGWGASAENLAGLAPELALPSYQFLFVNAPFPHPQMPDGWMWYDLSTQEGLTESKQLLQDWLLTLPEQTGIPLAQTVLAGFSQGGAMTLEVGLSLPLAGLVVLSGYLHPDTPIPATGLPPVLIAHGRQDPVVPLQVAQATHETLTQAGVQVNYHEFDMGHDVSARVIATVRQYVQNLSQQHQWQQVDT